MLDILKYIFSSPWIFVGTLVLIYALGEVIGNIVINICKAMIGSRAIKYLDKKDKDIDIKIE